MLLFEDKSERNQMLVLGLYETAFILTDNNSLTRRLSHYYYSFDFTVKLYNDIAGNVGNE